MTSIAVGHRERHNKDISLSDLNILEMNFFEKASIHSKK